MAVLPNLHLWDFAHDNFHVVLLPRGLFFSLDPVPHPTALILSTDEEIEPRRNREAFWRSSP
jgi:hypothetical protein